MAEAPERKSTRLRKLVQQRYIEGRAIIVPTAHDCVTAKLLEQAGCEHMNVAGAAPTAVWTGEPECGVATMTEMANVAYRVLGCVDIPGKASIAQGGNALNVIRAFHEYERAGAAMIQLEDQDEGHLSGYIPGKQLISVEEMVGKIQAAVYARHDPDIIIAARCDAKLANNGGLDVMISRCREYVDAGAEALMPHGMETMEEWDSVGRELRSTGVPLIASLSAGLLFTPKNQTRRELPTVAQLESMGWTLLNYANHLLHIQMTVARDYVEQLMTPPHDISQWMDKVMDNGERNAVLGLPIWRALEEAFVPSERVRKRYEKVRSNDNYVYNELDAARAQVREIMEKKGIKPL